MPIDYVALLEKTGQTDNERAREMAGRALVHRAVREQLIDHVYHGVLDGSLPPAAGSIIRVTHAEIHHLEFDTVLSIAGSAGVVDGDDDLIRFGERTFAADCGPRRRNHRDRAQHHRRTRAGLPTGVRRRPRRSVQSGEAQQELRKRVGDSSLVPLWRSASVDCEVRVHVGRLRTALMSAACSSVRPRRKAFGPICHAEDPICRMIYLASAGRG